MHAFSSLPVRGHAVIRLFEHTDTGLVLVHEQIEENLVTQLGDQMYAEAAAAIYGAPPTPIGMRLGTGTTAAAKTGAGAAIVTYLSGSQVTISSGWPQSSLVSAKRRITYRGEWAAGVATNSAIAEAVLTNESPLTNVAGAEANTIARLVFSPTINKSSSQVMQLDWHHDIG